MLLNPLNPLDLQFLQLLQGQRRTEIPVSHHVLLASDSSLSRRPTRVCLKVSLKSSYRNVPICHFAVQKVISLLFPDTEKMEIHCNTSQLKENQCGRFVWFIKMNFKCNWIHHAGCHHFFKPLGLGLVVEVHTAHQVISWRKTHSSTMRGTAEGI